MYIMVWLVLRAPKAATPYTYNGLGDFDTSMAQNHTKTQIKQIKQIQRAFENAKTIQKHK